MREIRKEYTLSHPCDKVWNAITDYKTLVLWLADSVRGRPREGGEFSWTWKLGLEGDFTTHGIYKTIDPGRLLLLQWKDHPAGDIFLSLELQSHAPGITRLILTNGGYPQSSHFDGFLEGAKAGWDDQIARLKKFLDSGTPI